MIAGRVGLLSLSVLLAVACSIAKTEQRVVEVEGGTIESRASLAASVIATLSPSLRVRTRERFPRVTTEHLAGLRLELIQMTGRQFGEGEAKPVDLVGIRCAMTLPEISVKSGPILDFCEELVRKEMAKRSGSPRT